MNDGLDGYAKTSTSDWGNFWATRMTSGDLCREAIRRMPGITVRIHHVDHAVKKGYVHPTHTTADGWRIYDRNAVNGLLHYMRSRSRSARRQMSEAANV